MARRVRRRSRRKRGIGFKFFFFLTVLFALVGGGVYAYFSPLFEKESPKIKITSRVFTNGSTPISFEVFDNVKLKDVKVYLSDGVQKKAIYAQTFMMPQKQKKLFVSIPKELLQKNKNYELIIEARDASYWNFFLGNKSIVSVPLIIDNEPPLISVIAMSPSITKGGSALVIYQVKDDELKKTYIDMQDGNKFIPITYGKKGVYATLIAWQFNHDSINPVIVAVDGANNKSILHLSIHQKFHKFRVSKLRATDRFINGKISELILSDPEFANISDKLQKFKAVNELMRKKNEDYIHKMSKNVTPISTNWRVNAFRPLHGFKRVGYFGDKRYYYYNDPNNIISTSYHLGMDIASIKHDNIYSSNPGVVVSTKPNGIYGNMPLINHGFGLYTLYGHCSSILVQKGQKVAAHQIIAKTGTSGLALGDHLHFGVLIQGIEVMPSEWMNRDWVKRYINDIFDRAKQIIGYN